MNIISVAVIVLEKYTAALLASHPKMYGKSLWTHEYTPFEIVLKIIFERKYTHIYSKYQLFVLRLMRLELIDLIEKKSRVEYLRTFKHE